MTAYLKPIWDNYLKHRNLELLREDILSYPWYEPPQTADESLLMRAVEHNDVGAVQLLLSMGENPNLPALDGFTFLHQAVDHAADVGAVPKDDCVETAPRPAAEVAVLIALLEGGADPNTQGMDGTPLHRAAGSGDVRSARILLGYGADIEARMLVDGELTPLQHAALFGHVQMVQFLLDSGAKRSAMSRASPSEPPMTLCELLKAWKVANVDKILAILAR
ncbi:MAG: ankyrin repeat domain-containing protein [Planctomycetes bacterium]|nr:ankyrin repeat domain-containing protein [Planctomycetota bacterium]